MLKVVLDLSLVSLLIASALALARCTRRGAQLGAPMLVLLLSLAVAGTGFAPGATARQWIGGPITALAVAVLLLPLDVRRLLPQGRALLRPYAAAIGLVCGAAVVFGWALARPLGPAHGALAGVLAAGFTGGSVNQVGVAESLALAPPLFALVMAADNVTGILWFLICMTAGLGVTAEAAPVLLSEEEKPQRDGIRRRLRTLALGLGVVFLSIAIQRLLLPWALPLLLSVTSLALLIAQIPATASQRLDPELGMMLMLPFFSLIGLTTSWRELLPAGSWLLLLAVSIVAVQGVVLCFVARKRRSSLERALVASQAAIGGPTTAVALAIAMGRRDLLLPGTALGMLGYLVGSYLGLGVARTVSLLG